MDTTQQANNTNIVRRASRPAGWKVALASLGGAALLTACASLGSGSGSGSGSSGVPASPNGTVTMPTASSSASSGVPCRQVTSLHAQLAELTQMTGQTVPARQVASFAAHVQHEATALMGQVGGAFATQANELLAELAEVGKDARAHRRLGCRHRLRYPRGRDQRDHGGSSAAPGQGQVRARAPLLNGLYDAKLDHAPVLAITGMQETSVLGTGYQQEANLDKLYADVGLRRVRHRQRRKKFAEAFLRGQPRRATIATTPFQGQDRAAQGVRAASSVG